MGSKPFTNRSQNAPVVDSGWLIGPQSLTSCDQQERQDIFRLGQRNEGQRENALPAILECEMFGKAEMALFLSFLNRKHK
jgi:hypothetical protein